MNLDKNLISQRLYEIMSKKGLNAQEFSRITEISRSTLEGYLKATSMIKTESLIKICEKLQIDVHYILGIGNDMDRNPSCGQLPKDEESMLQSYRLLSDEDKDFIKDEMTRLRRLEFRNQKGAEYGDEIAT